MQKNELFEECLKRKVSTDTRKIEQGDVFIALKGENFDGNKYCEDAINNGAEFCISDASSNSEKEKIIIVESSLDFLQTLANYKRKKLNIPFIGITGSNGKTTNKELIHAILSKKYKVSATKGNFNNHLGVPFTLLDIQADAEIAIIEMGANQPNDIGELCEIAEPNFGLITNIGSAHLEGFGGIQGVINAKRQLYDYLGNNSENTIVYNSKDKILTELLPNVKTFQYNSENSLYVSDSKVDPFLSFRYHYKDYSSPILNTNLVGDYNLHNFQAAISFGILFNVPFEKINEAIQEYQPDNNRSQLTKTEKNTLIMDCYNANPTSMKAALENFSNVEGDNKLAIIGDMLELGEETDKEHINTIEFVKNKNITTLFVGSIFNRIENSDNSFETVEELLENYPISDISDKIVLLKGSRGIKLEKLAEFL